MQRSTALALAGRTARLVARPTGVAHVYTGPLTPSGRSIPRSGRPACRAWTRRLYVLSPAGDVADADPRGLCTRCVTCLAVLPRPAGQVTSRSDYLATYGHVTAGDLAADAVTATTAEEIDTVGHLSLLVVGHQASNAAGLTQLLARHRFRVAGSTSEAAAGRARAAEAAAAAVEQRKANAREVRERREDQVARIGINNATRGGP